MAIRTSQDAAAIVTALYVAEADPPMSAVLSASGASADHDIADAIEADARERLARELPIPLSRYLNAVPHMHELRVALDAAIEFSLRAAIASGQSEEDAARRLMAEHPAFAPAIDTAVALSDGLASTATLGRSAGRTVPLKVPCEYGPRLADGRRRFDVRERLGVGAQGEVYLAADHLLSDADRPAWVAIKRLRPIATVDAANHAASESLKARRISHPNVVRVLDRGTDDRSIEYIVYENVDGGDLARWFAQQTGPVPPREAARLVALIGRGVHAAHLAGVVHCDLKPSNILITRAGEPKVADFGVAAAIRSDSGRIPDATPVGNLAFIAPEQFRADDGAQAIPADVYALGGLLYFLLTGKPPNGETPAQVAARHAHVGTPAPSPHALRPDIDPDLDAICRRALAPDASNRYASAHALAEDLEAWLDNRPLEWQKPGPRRRLALLARRQPGLLIAILLILVTLILGAGSSVYIAMRGRERVLQERYAAVEQIQKRQRDAIESVQNLISTTLNVMDRRDGSALNLDWLPTLTILESVAGPVLFDSHDSRFKMNAWSMRVTKAREIIDKAEKAGRGDHIDTLFWRDSLAFWGLRAGDFDTADKALRHNDPIYATFLRPDETWALARAGMHGCVDVQRIVTNLASNPKITPDDLAAARAAEESLLAAIGAMAESDHWRSMRVMFMVNLRRLYARDILNKTRESIAIQQSLVTLEQVPADAAKFPAAPPPLPAPPPPTTR